MTGNPIAEIIAGIRSGDVIPYLGAGTLRGVVDNSGKQIPADSESLILAMNNGQPMAPRLMYEFPRAAMNVENKRGRGVIERFLTQTYGQTQWSESPLHKWIADLRAPYVIDINRDTQLQTLYRDRAHTLIVGAARIAGTHFRFDIYQFDLTENNYRKIEQAQIDMSLPILFKPMGTPLPKPSYIASDADYVDYITELMGGFAVPAPLKKYREGKRYLLLGVHFTRDTERMVFGDLIYGADAMSGWALIPDPNAKEQRFLAKKNMQIVEADWSKLIDNSLANAALTDSAEKVA
ncbi:MAG: SIR2 family protein [Spongiibacteraceae bacterium]